MSGRKIFGVLAVITALSVLGAASVAAGPDRRLRGGYVIPCSLDGVNPVYHPRLFGNPAVAQAYGFVKWPDGTWRVRNNCHKY